MKLINLLTLGLVFSKFVEQNITATEDDELVRSVEQNITATEDDELVRSVDELILKYLEDQPNTPRQARLLRIMESAPAPRIEPIAKIGTEEEAKIFLNYAGASYCDAKGILNWSCSNCEGYSVNSTDVEYFTDDLTKTAGFLAVDISKKLIILSYRGSSNLSNWIFNFKFLFTNAYLKYPYDDAKIHNGFNYMANALYDESRDALDRALQKYPNFKINFIGHSLGGALAGLIAFKLAKDDILAWDRINVITYGQPRLGNLKFAEYLNSKPWTYTRVTSYADIVAVSPWHIMGYRHNQFNMHIDENGKTIQCSKYEEDSNCKRLPILPRINAHFNFWNMKINTKC